MSPSTPIESKLPSFDRRRTTLAHVVYSMNVGGAERSIARLINALDHRYFRPIVVCLSRTGPAVDWINSPDVPVFEIRQNSTFDRQALRRLTRVLVEQNVDIVHSYNWGTLMESTLACRKAGVAAHIHAERGTVLGGVEMRGLRMRMRGVCAAWAMRRCDAIVTNAGAVATKIQVRCGFPASRVHVIPNGVEKWEATMTERERTSQRSELGIGSKSVLVGSVGRLVPVKGFDLAIQAVAGLVDEGHDCHLLLIGEGPLKDSLGSLADSLGVRHRLHLVGHQQDPARWCELVDVYVNTSHSEGMSQSLVEAMAAGRPVIATNVGDSAVVVGDGGAYGRIIDAGNSDQLADAIRSIMPIEERRRLSLRAVERHASEFTLSKMAKRYTELYEAVLKTTTLPSGAKP